jgi:hypothetical protein
MCKFTLNIYYILGKNNPIFCNASKVKVFFKGGNFSFCKFFADSFSKHKFVDGDEE